MSVCIVGSVNQDVVARVERLPRPGETVLARELRRFQGGKGANQAVAAARMGASVHLIGAVGRDETGTALLDGLATEGIDITAVRRLEGVATGTAHITIAADGENQIVVVAGANAHVGADPSGVPEGTRVLLAQLETPIAATATLFADPRGARRILNTAPAVPEAAGLFAITDLLILNQTELASYLHLAEEPRTAAEAAIARRLLTRDGQAAVVTLGAAGAALVERDGLLHAPAVRVPVVDTTGAGDCFCGALAALLAEDRPIRDALAIANAAAALAVQREGAGPAMPTRAEVDAATEGSHPIKTAPAPRLGLADRPREMQDDE